MLLSIIVPVFNEEKTLADVIDILIGLPGENQIILVDDCSSDSSLSILESYQNTPGLVICRHEKNQGKGKAIRTGLEFAEGDFTVIQDADLEYDPNDIIKMLDTAKRHSADAVFGSRIHNPQSGISYRRFYWGGKLLTLLANLLYGVNISDESTCYKLVRTDLMKSFNLTCKRFEFCPELVARLGKQNIKIFEIPISYTPRKIHEGKKIRWHDGAEAIWTLLKLRFMN